MTQVYNGAGENEYTLNSGKVVILTENEFNELFSDAICDVKVENEDYECQVRMLEENWEKAERELEECKKTINSLNNIISRNNYER